MNVILMAQGDGIGWKGKNPKHFALINRTPVIARTVKQVQSLGHDVTVVGWQEYNDCLDVPIVTQKIPIPELLEGIWNIRDLWLGKDSAILLGDVVFSWACLTEILSGESLRFYGREGGNPITGSPHGELYGFRFSESQSTELAIDLEKLVNRNISNGLWMLYRHVIGVDLDEHIVENKVLYDPEDYTDDIDSVEEYEKAKLILDKLVEADADTRHTKQYGE